MERTTISIDRLPLINAFVDAGTDYVTMYGFGLTALAVLVGAFVTIWSFRGTVRSQEKLARAIAVKESRQAWINELRDTCAEYVSAVLTIQRLWNLQAGHGNIRAALVGDNFEAAARLATEWANDHVSAMANANKLKAKIELLSNPAEDLFIDLLVEVARALVVCDQQGAHADEPCNSIVQIAQRILKIEWDKTRNMQ